MSLIALGVAYVVDYCSTLKDSFCIWAYDVLDNVTEEIAYLVEAFWGLFQRAADYVVDGHDNSMH